MDCPEANYLVFRPDYITIESNEGPLGGYGIRASFIPEPLLARATIYIRRRLWADNFEGQLDNTHGVMAMAMQTDGKVLIAGSFTTVQGESRNGIARLNPDGSLDSEFNPGGGLDGTTRIVALQPDGKIIVGGDFQNVDGAPFSCVVRLLSNGPVDSTFVPALVSSSVATPPRVATLNVQPDGKIVIGGIFTHLDGISHVCVGRVEGNGKLDGSFVLRPNNIVLSSANFSNGDILLGGGFKLVDGIDKVRVARASKDGILDQFYNRGTGPDATVLSVLVDPQSRGLISGGFATYDGVSTSGIARVLADGTIDSGFLPQITPVAGVDITLISGLLVQENGKIFVGRLFGAVAGVGRNSLARLNDDGTLDETFDPGTGPDDGINAVMFDHQGNLWVAGYFDVFNGAAHSHLVRYLRQNPTAVELSSPTFSDGSFGFSFTTETGFTYEVQQCLDLTPRVWETVQVFGGDGSIMTVTGLRRDLDKAFFRLRIE